MRMHSYHATDRSGHALSASVALSRSMHAADGSAPKISDHSSAPEGFAARRKPRLARESSCAVKSPRLGRAVVVRGFVGSWEQVVRWIIRYLIQASRGAAAASHKGFAAIPPQIKFRQTSDK
ncbi:hypothetical protein HBH56_101700 [Parastagonospora nodorum]|uniref:Uncharacterized protein n=1 Tax=Phaeosphaeria nodorum (strain SN15 / ATCC MYA-4574 / FGSC 10173) TaxID=321614 RepID=A0A7U2I5T5_PHANO|nr:hypothetical protein HBH56_101700 [Parastagonospora nodorum]QRD04461.1 hypothetical protein JI435_421190 [Parastagonospora nodorum SN15]KAH3929491.1 hypothetical protein HBH54_128730 [Parastagonospora nodorum]KAH3951428.1 hypothetical protein HBH53_062720 [Parastagonospora nodorum]KAH3975599.1 hypothetical protein HBH52_124130 [Parastagonospora nodorum]